VSASALAPCRIITTVEAMADMQETKRTT